MKYVRVIYTKIHLWFTSNPSIESIADHFFNLKKAQNNPSLYRAFTEIDEVRAASAHLLAGEQSDLDSQYVLRVDLSDLYDSGLCIDEDRLGKTGIVAIDFAHCEIPRDRAKTKLLVERIVNRLKAGEDRLRRIGKSQLEHQLQLIQYMPPEDVTPLARQRCSELLKNTVEIDQNALPSSIHIPTNSSNELRTSSR